MKTRLLSILLTIMMVLSIFALTSCDDLIASITGKIDHEHDWSEWETIKSPDCQNPGTAERFCDCGETQTKSLPISDHKESDWKVDKEATCEEEGSRHKECTVCHAVLASEKLDKADHSYSEWIDEVPATTEKEGTLGHYHCSVCKKNFDANKNELASIVIPKLDTIPHEHEYGEWIVTKDPTCEATGLECRDCNICGAFEVQEIRVIPELGHDKVQHEAKDPTCVEIGWYAYETCTRCEYTTFVEIPVTDHTIVSDEWVVINSPDCDNKGQEKIACSNCDAWIIRDIPELGHDKVQHDAQDATCTELGWNAYETCTRCSYSTYVEIPALGHEKSEWRIDEEATYEEDGLKHKACTRCGIILEEEIIPKLSAVEHNIYYHGIDTNEDFPTSFAEHLGVYELPKVEKIGHETGYWKDQYGKTVECILKGTNEDVHLYAVLGAPKQYKIEYTNAAQNSNPTTYTIYDEITFSNPNWPGLIFSHWTDESNSEVTGIRKGTIGNIKVEANWKYAQNLAISNPNNGTYIGGMLDSKSNYYFIYDVGTIENVVLSTQYTLKYDGSNTINRTESITYKVQNSEAQTVSTAIANTILSSASFSSIKDFTSGDTNSSELNVCPEIEYAGVKLKVFEYKTGTSNYEEQNFTDTKSTVKEHGSSSTYEIDSYISYVFEEETSTQVSINLSPEISPKGTYRYVRAADVSVYVIVVYNPDTNQYYSELYTQVEDVYNRTLFELSDGDQYDVNIEKCDQLSFELTMSVIPESFYMVKYDANGGEGDMLKSVHEIGVSSNLIPNAFTKEGYTFSGWKTSIEGSIALYSDTAKICNIAKSGETITLYAHWTPNPYTVTFDVAGGDPLSTTTHSVTFDDKYSKNGSLPKPTRTGYDFLGWYNGNILITDESIVTIAADHTLTAKWDSLTYTVIFDGNTGVTSIGTIDVLRGEKYGELPVPEKYGYNFDGWFTEIADGIKIDKDSVVESTESKTITLYAHWSPKVYYVYIVELDLRNAKKVQYGESLTWSVWNEYSGTFQGWYYATSKAYYSGLDGAGLESKITSSRTFTITIDETTPIHPSTYDTIDGEVYIASRWDSNCITGDTLVTLADGSSKAAEDLLETDILLVYDHATGKYVPSSIIFIENDGCNYYNVIYLEYSNGTVNKIIYEHALFDITLNMYVYIREDNYRNYIGHEFAYFNGEYIESVTLNDAYVKNEYTGCYSLITAVHFNYFIDGMFSMPGGMEGLLNIFEYGEELRFDAEKMQEDIDTYGLYTYEDFSEYVPEEVFYAFQAQYFKVAIGKGYITFDEILEMIDKYLVKNGVI